METIKIKETSKSGVIANVNGIFGQLSNGTFVPYSQEQLAKKTAYKDSYGWKEYSSLEEYQEARKKINENRAIERAELAKRYEVQRKEENERLMAMIASGPIPATVENIRLLLRWLNDQNWGSWRLPKMTIGYSANQYDCDGTTATTITLDQPISDEELSIENETKFVYGAPRGHLNKYRRI